MKIKFLGAARTVTGSCFIIETDQARFAVDCGMHQGSDTIERRNLDTTPYDPARIDFFIITHAHIDHSGLLPRMVQHGFSGPIYATEPTGDLLNILLLDSAHIQEVEAAGKNKRYARTGMKTDAVPLYTVKDAEAVTPHIKTRKYDETFSPGPGISVRFQDAGHILGAAMVELFIEENGETSKLVFSGDIGRPRQLLMKDPCPVREADYLFMESTYGNRNHKGEQESLEELASAIRYSYKNGEKVVIPAFAVERTQEILYSLHLLLRDGKLPKDMPVYLDSPLAIKATEIFHHYHSYLDGETQILLKNGEDPLRLPNLKLSVTTEESVRINETREPAIVISASGMANAGRIKHHLRHNLWRSGASIVFVGFQAEGTPGRKIVDGAKKIRIFNEDIAVAAKVFTINGFSAHAGQDQLLDWLKGFQNKGMQVFLVHGESSAQDNLASLIREKFGFSVTIPDYLEEIRLKPGRPIEEIKPSVAAVAQINLSPLLADLKIKLDDVGGKMGKFQTLSSSQQAEIADLLKQATLNIDKIKDRS
ncbi:MAG: MBL fold hydrolase [Deltaproteobacteria bacterium HGW-Deltaproteobacteria-6]|jgi:metallo-beta-lactamase family protein|nr:MAG: MBL fold hydrolase [Deltaproteobacteria bacterium HGW-Deltaproteobacteria-6]